jgi:TolB-like protein/DNA-binding SARP family transcriptional activator
LETGCRSFLPNQSAGSRLHSVYALHLLGGASVHGEAGPISGPVTQRRRLAVLALLAASPAGRVSRDKIVAYLWPDADAEHGRHQLVDAIYALRRALGRTAVLSMGDELRLNPAVIRSDVDEMSQACARCDWARAVQVYRGTFLDGFLVPAAAEFEHWVDAERERWGRIYARALEALAAERERAADLTGAADCWRSLSAHDPYSSRVALALLRVLERAGNPGGAVQHALAHEALLREALDMPPDPEVLALASRLRQPRPPRDTAFGQVAAAAGPAPVGSAAYAGPAPVGSAAPAGPRPPPLPDPVDPGIAVLPIVDLSLGRDDHFADGVTANLMHAVIRVDGLRTATKATTLNLEDQNMPAHPDASRLQVAHLVDGTMRKSGDRMRVTAQLVDARTGFPLWSGTFDWESTDDFTVQQEVTRAIAGALARANGGGW